MGLQGCYADTEYIVTPIITIMHTTIHGVIAIYFTARILRICMTPTKCYNDILLITIFDCGIEMIVITRVVL